MADPNSPQEWNELSIERASDVESMLPARNTSVGPVYMSGYIVECALKAYLLTKRISWQRGREGHNLRNLWKASGFKLCDLNDRNGAKTYFIQCWSTDLRYERTYNLEIPISELLDGARSLASWIKRQTIRGRR